MSVALLCNKFLQTSGIENFFVCEKKSVVTAQNLLGIKTFFDSPTKSVLQEW